MIEDLNWIFWPTKDENLLWIQIQSLVKAFYFLEISDIFDEFVLRFWSKRIFVDISAISFLRSPSKKHKFIMVSLHICTTLPCWIHSQRILHPLITSRVKLLNLKYSFLGDLKSTHHINFVVENDAVWWAATVLKRRYSFPLVCLEIKSFTGAHDRYFICAELPASNRVDIGRDIGNWESVSSVNHCGHTFNLIRLQIIDIAILSNNLPCRRQSPSQKVLFRSYLSPAHVPKKPQIQRGIDFLH